MRLDHTNPDSVARCIRNVTRTLHGLRANLQRQLSTMPVPSERQELSDEGLDVRLLANVDGELWFATGDVQYDTVHSAACEAVTVSPNSDDDELQDSAAALVNGVAGQLAE
jgi:hypothetical protein